MKSSRLTRAFPLSNERCFSGDIAGLPGFEKIIIPKWCFSDFSAEQLQAELASLWPQFRQSFAVQLFEQAETLNIYRCLKFTMSV